MSNLRTPFWISLIAILAVLLFAWLLGAFDGLIGDPVVPPPSMEEGGPVGGVSIDLPPEEVTSIGDARSAPVVVLKGADKEDPVLTFLVVDRRGKPLAGVPVELLKGDNEYRAKRTHLVRTDSTGTVRLPSVNLEDVDWANVLDEARRAALPNHNYADPDDAFENRETYWVRGVRVTEWTTTLRSDFGIPVEMHFFDRESGKRLRDVKWGMNALPLEGSSTALGQTARVKPGVKLHFDFHVEAPAGYVAWNKRMTEVRVAGATKKLLNVYPLHREQVFEFSILESDGTPFRGDVHAETRVGFDAVPKRVWKHQGARGHVSKGIPWRSGADVSVKWTCEVGTGSWKTVMPDASGEVLRATVTMDPHDLDAPIESPKTHGGIGVGGSRSVMGDRDKPATGTLRVRCIRGNGQPAASVRVYFTGTKPESKPTSKDYFTRLKADEKGIVEKSDMPVGDWVVEFTDWFKVSGSVEVLADQVAHLDLKEILGGQAEVEFVDDHGDPVPFVKVSASHAEHGYAWRPSPDEHGVQRIDSFTDNNGRRTLRRLYPGQNVLFPSRKKFTVTEGKTVQVRAKVPAPRR